MVVPFLPAVDEGLKLPIDETNIKTATKRDSHNCPVAKALDKLFGDSYFINSGQSDAILWSKTDNREIKFVFSEELKTVVWQFDEGEDFVAGTYQLTRVR